jgi:glutathione S-transferase
MSTPVIHGFAQSSYVITARATAAVKGVEIDFQQIQPGEHKGPEHLSRHPWGRVPAFEHDGLQLFETDAIVRYLDEAFEGPALQPKTPGDRARMAQWISVTNCYLYGHMVPDYILKYVFAGDAGPDRADIDAAVPIIADDLKRLEAGIGEGPFLVGDTVSLADLFVVPLIMGITRFPEGVELVTDHLKLQMLIAATVDTPGFMSAFETV